MGSSKTLLIVFLLVMTPILYVNEHYAWLKSQHQMITGYIQSATEASNSQLAIMQQIYPGLQQLLSKDDFEVLYQLNESQNQEILQTPNWLALHTKLRNYLYQLNKQIKTSENVQTYKEVYIGTNKWLDYDQLLLYSLDKYQTLGEFYNDYLSQFPQFVLNLMVFRYPHFPLVQTPESSNRN